MMADSAWLAGQLYGGGMFGSAPRYATRYSPYGGLPPTSGYGPAPPQAPVGAGNPPWNLLNSGAGPGTGGAPNSTVRSASLNSGAFTPGPTPPGVMNFMPGFNQQMSAANQGLGAAAQKAAASRASAKMAYGQNLDAISGDVGNRGVEFSGIPKQLNQLAGNTYEQNLSNIAADLASARAQSASHIADINAANLAFRQGEKPPMYGPGMFGTNMSGVLEALRMGPGGGQAYNNPQGGAYGMSQKMWEQYGGTGPISKAPQQVQDRIAMAAVTSILGANQNNMEMVPAMFHYGAAAQAPWAGTGIQNYVNSWLNAYRTLYGGGVGGGASNRRYG